MSILVEGVRTLTEADWTVRQAEHQRRVDGWIDPHLERRRRGRRHPVEDFLFTYYSLRPAKLRRWYPGHGVRLTGPVAEALPSEPGYGEYRCTAAGVELDPRAVVRRVELVSRIHRLLAGTVGRTANFGCFGLHEWAMVYRQSPEAIRHADWPLRLGADGTDQVVAEQRLRCSHFDAYRFFTAAARPRNELQPTRERQPELENPGCLHANMDLYKWAYKLLGLVPSELVADCFELAREIRILDMRASPYDLSALGFSPVPIETPQGRASYARDQRAFAERAAPLRRRLIAHCADLLRVARTWQSGRGAAGSVPSGSDRHAGTDWQAGTD